MADPSEGGKDSFLQLQKELAAFPQVEPRFKKPKQTPQWVWNQYVEEIKSPSLRPIEEIENYLAILEVLVSADAATMRKIWTPLAKRAAIADEKMNSRRDVSVPRRLSVHRRVSELLSIADRVLVVKDTFQGHYLHTRRSRARSGAAIAKHALSLARELSELAGTNHSLPRVIEIEIKKMNNAAIEIEWIVELLQYIARGGQAWKATQPLLAKPSQVNSKRTMLFRVLTKYFYSVYGQPLYGVTLAVAGLFYNCANIDEAQVSKLAAVPKQKFRAATAP